MTFNTNQTRTPLYLALIWVIFFCLMFMHTSTAAAHSEMVKSEPQDGESLDQSPAQVTAWFSEELDSGSSTLRVFDSQNNQVDNSDGGVDLNDLDHLSMVVSLPPLQAGTYSVHWVSVSAEDGDEEEGDFSFIVSGRAASRESSTPLANGFPTWLVGGGIILLVFIGLMWFLFIRKKAPD